MESDYQRERTQFNNIFKKENYKKFTQKINKDCNDVADIIFSEESNAPLPLDNIYNKNLVKSFYPLENLTTKQSSKKHQGQNKLQEKSSFKREKSGHHKEHSISNSKDDFFDTFDKEVDQKKFNAFKRNFDLKEELETNICILNNRIFDANDYDKDSKDNNEEKKDENDIFTADDFFANADDLIGEKNEEKEEKLNEEEDINLNDDPKIVNIEKISQINKYLKIEADEPLWYIYHSKADSSFGPISSQGIADLYRENVINGESEIRLIDIFTYNGEKNFKFFKLKEIEKDSFKNKITLSDLVQNALNNKIGKK